MAQFEIKDGVAIIPEGVVTIGHGAFSRCEELQSVVIPEGVVRNDQSLQGTPRKAFGDLHPDQYEGSGPLGLKDRRNP